MPTVAPETRTDDHLALGRMVRGIEELRALAIHHRPVAFFEIGDAAGQRGQRQGIGADEHLALAKADGERRPLPRRQQQPRMAGEDGGQREGAVHPLQRGGEGGLRRQPLVQEVIDQADEGLGIRLGLEHRALGFQFGAQFGMVLDDAVMHHADPRRAVRMGVALGRRAMRGPAGMADAGGAGQRVAVQHAGQVAELAFRPAPFDVRIHQRGDAGAVIATVFQPPQCLQQQRRCIGLADGADDATHGHPLLALEATPLLVPPADRAQCPSASSGTSSVMTLPAAIRARSPTRTGATSAGSCDEGPRADFGPVLVDAV